MKDKVSIVTGMIASIISTVTLDQIVYTIVISFLGGALGLLGQLFTKWVLARIKCRIAKKKLKLGN